MPLVEVADVMCARLCSTVVVSAGTAQGALEIDKLSSSTSSLARFVVVASILPSPPLVFVRCRGSHFHLLNACFVCLPSIATAIAVVDRAIAPPGLAWREDSLGYALWRRAVLARRSACVLDFLTSRCTRRSVVVVVFSTRCRSASSSSRGFSSLAASRGANPCPARIATGDARAARARALCGSGGLAAFAAAAEQGSQRLWCESSFSRRPSVFPCAPRGGVSPALLRASVWCRVRGGARALGGGALGVVPRVRAVSLFRPPPPLAARGGCSPHAGGGCTWRSLSARGDLHVFSAFSTTLLVSLGCLAFSRAPPRFL